MTAETWAQLCHKAAFMLNPGEQSREELRQLQAAYYHLGVILGKHPKPATDQDRAANAEAAKYESV